MEVVLQTTDGLGFNLYIASLLVVNDTASCPGLWETQITM